MKRKQLPIRLKTTAEFVRHGSAVADIGCDHGYLPIYLVENNIADFVIASDINKGPIESAVKNVSLANLSDKIECRLSDGLKAYKKGECFDFVFAGMGGELIRDIIADCNFLKDEKVHLIFQPMTHAEAVAKYLCENGFELGKRVFLEENKKFYTVFDAYYIGKVLPHDEAYFYLFNIENYNDSSAKGYILHLLNYFKNKQKGENDFSHIIEIIEEHYDNR